MLYYNNYSELDLYLHKINKNTKFAVIYRIYITAVAARWRHLYRSRGYQTKAVNESRLSSRRSSAADRQLVKRDYTNLRLYGLLWKRVAPPGECWLNDNLYPGWSSEPEAKLPSFTEEYIQWCCEVGGARVHTNVGDPHPRHTTLHFQCNRFVTLG